MNEKYLLIFLCMDRYGRRWYGFYDGNMSEHRRWDEWYCEHRIDGQFANPEPMFVVIEKYGPLSYIANPLVKLSKVPKAVLDQTPYA